MQHTVIAGPGPHAITPLVLLDNRGSSQLGHLGSMGTITSQSGHTGMTGSNSHFSLLTSSSNLASIQATIGDKQLARPSIDGMQIKGNKFRVLLSVEFEGAV